MSAFRTLFLLIATGCVAATLFSCESPSETGGTPETVEEQLSATSGTASGTAETTAPEAQLRPEMWTAFQRFRVAMLAKDRNVLAAMCVPGLENGCAYEETDKDSVAYKLCDLPDEAQLAVLEKRSRVETKIAHKKSGCIYEDVFTIDEDGNGFSWLVGCMHLLEDEIGEYGTTFEFKKINGKFRISRVYCAG